jgi:hypothetical protein
MNSFLLSFYLGLGLGLNFNAKKFHDVYSFEKGIYEDDYYTNEGFEHPSKKDGKIYFTDSIVVLCKPMIILLYR